MTIWFVAAICMHTTASSSQRDDYALHTALLYTTHVILLTDFVHCRTHSSRVHILMWPTACASTHSHTRIGECECNMHAVACMLAWTILDARCTRTHTKAPCRPPPLPCLRSLFTPTPLASSAHCGVALPANNTTRPNERRDAQLTCMGNLRKRNCELAAVAWWCCAVRMIIDGA